MKKQILSLAAGAALVFAASNSFAGSAAGGSIDYQVVLTGGCTVTTTPTTPIPLGTQDSVAGNITGATAGTLGVTCSNATDYGICVGGGSNTDGTTRYLDGLAPLTSGTDQLAYDLKIGGVSVGDDGCAALAGAGTDTATWADPLGAPAGVIDGSISGTAAEQLYNLTADVIIPITAKVGTYEDTGVLLTVVW